MCAFTLLLVTGAITPFIGHLHDPSRRHVVYTRRPVIHSKPDSSPRLLVLHTRPRGYSYCHQCPQYFLSPTHQSPITIYILHVIVLAGRANSLLTDQSPSIFEHLVSIFRFSEQSSHSLVSVVLFNTISKRRKLSCNIQRGWLWIV